VLEAILPSSVIAYFHTENGRPNATLCRRASLTRRTAIHAADSSGLSATDMPGDIACTVMPAASNAVIAWPRNRGSGCGKPITMRDTPLCTNASTADHSPAHGPCAGSRFRYAEWGPPVSEGTLRTKELRYLFLQLQLRSPSLLRALLRGCRLVQTALKRGSDVDWYPKGRLKSVPGMPQQQQCHVCQLARSLGKTLLSEATSQHFYAACDVAPDFGCGAHKPADESARSAALTKCLASASAQFVVSQKRTVCNA